MTDETTPPAAGSTGPDGGPGQPDEPGQPDGPWTPEEVPVVPPEDAPAPVPDEVPIEPAEPPGVEPADAGWVAPPGSSDGGRSRRGWIIAAVAALVIVPLVVIVGIVFLGSQVSSLQKGTVEFGTGGTGCSISGSATSFPASSPIHVVAYMEREVPAGETLTVSFTGPNGLDQKVDRSFDSAGTCIAADIPGGNLAPGHYALEYRSGTEVLSKGEFDVTS